MLFSDNHILSTILFTPLVGAILMLVIPRQNTNAHRWMGNLFGFLGFAVSLPLVWRFKFGETDFQFRQTLDWIPSINAHYSIGIDGISLLMVMLTTILGAIAILSSWSAIQKREKEYYILLLLLQTGVWGSDRRLYAAIKFFLYTLAGSVVMLLAILAIYFRTNTFDIREILLSHNPIFSPQLQTWLFWGFFFAFAIKVPMFPFHTWLPDAHTEAPTAGSVILAGVLLKMGTYGFLRFSVPMFPDATMRFRWIMIVLSIIGIVYGALVCMMQKDMKKLIAYSSVSHMGFCTLGIFALTPLGLSGSIIQQVNHGISTGALFLVVGVLYERRHTRLISEFGGLSTPMPNFAAAYLIITLSSLGMPLLNGFVGEFTILRGVFEVRWQWAAWGVLGVVLGAAYLLWLYQRVMFGNITNPLNEHLPDLNGREFFTLGTLIILAFWIGIYPAPLFNVLDKPVKQIVLRYDPNYYTPQSTASAAPAGGASIQIVVTDKAPAMKMSTPAAAPQKDSK